MKHLLILSFIALFTCKASGQIGFLPKDVNGFAGKLKINLNDTTADIKVSPSNAKNYNGKWASYLGNVQSVAVESPTVAYVTMWYKTRMSKLSIHIQGKLNVKTATRLKGKLAYAEGKILIRDSQLSLSVTRNHSFTRAIIGDPGCLCITGEPNKTVLIDSKENHN